MFLLCACSSVPTEQDQALVKPLTRKMYDEGKGTPWQYASDQIGSRSIYLANSILKGKLTPLDPKRYETSRTHLRDLKKDIEDGQNWPYKTPSQVKLPFLTVEKNSWPDWKRSPAFNGEYPISKTEKSRDDSKWWIGWNYDYLFVAAEFKDDKITSYDYDEKKKTCPWFGDALEVFIRSELRYRNYWEIIVTPTGFVFDGLQQNNCWGGYIGNPDDHISGLKKKTVSANGTYRIELAIPWKEMPGYTRGNKPQKGDNISFILIRCNNGKQSSCMPILYGGHNLFGHIQATLE